MIGGTLRWNAIDIGWKEWQLAKQHSRNALVKHLTDPSFLLEQTVEYLGITAKDKSKTHQFGKKALTAEVHVKRF